ncbi:MAG: hypothetical protein FJ256_05815 [Phycisphaerae bacterium]|nr:hypothetical protein [Phycisphaerae bacterium]
MMLVVTAIVAALSVSASGPPVRGAAPPASALDCFGEAGEQRIVRLAGGSGQADEELKNAREELVKIAAELVAASKPPQGSDDKQPNEKGKSGSSSKRGSALASLRPKLEALTQSAATVRIMQLVGAAPDTERMDVAQEYLTHAAFARALALIVDPSSEDAGKVQRVARLLMQERSDAVDAAPELAAAVSVVYDAPVVAQVNENLVSGSGALPVFDHLCRNERSLIFGIKDVPSEAWVFVVDVAAPEAEMQWAVQQFAKQQDIGALYDRVEYDNDHLEKGTPKKVTQAGWNLPNILKHGGVCADQAYFCATVSKSLGAPAAVTVGRDGSLSHAWIGYAMRGRGGPMWAEWGRFGGYVGVEGMILHPQTGKSVSSTLMPMLTEYGRTPAADRRLVAGLRIAAAETKSVDDALELARIGLQIGVTDSRTWDVVARAAAGGKMSDAQKTQWSDDVITLCIDSYPEFAWRMIEPMITSIPDAQERLRVLDRFAGVFSARGDIVGQILMQEARLLETAGDFAAAGRCYDRIISNHANDGPFAFDAALAGAKILRSQGNMMGLIQFVQRAYRNMEPPDGISPIFARQTNWYRCGSMLVDALRAAGQNQQADLIRNQMDSVMK